MMQKLRIFAGSVDAGCNGFVARGDIEPLVSHELGHSFSNRATYW